MAKQGQHKHDANDQRISKGPNNPDKSVTTTTGGSKKRETVQAQSARHEDTERPGQADKNEWREDTREQPNSITRAQEARVDRDGSDSNADSATRGN